MCKELMLQIQAQQRKSVSAELNQSSRSWWHREGGEEAGGTGSGGGQVVVGTVGE